MLIGMRPTTGIRIRATRSRDRRLPIGIGIPSPNIRSPKTHS